MASKKRANPTFEGSLLLYTRLVASLPALELKGASMPYTAHNGHMFSYLDPTGTMALRLDEEQRKDFIKKYQTELMVSHGAVMKEYVKVPDQLLEETAELKKWLQLSHEYIQTLKPRPTKKK